jgi:hypothetical protein
VVSSLKCISYYDATFHKHCRIFKDRLPRQPTLTRHCPHEQREIPQVAILTCDHWPDESRSLSKAKRGKIAFPAASQGKEQIYPSSPSVSKAPWENFSADTFGRFWPVSTPEKNSLALLAIRSQVALTHSQLPCHKRILNYVCIGRILGILEPSARG